MSSDFKYAEIAGTLAGQIKKGILKTGDRLPSVRTLSQQHCISINTAKRVFVELEAQSLIDAKPQSGFFVAHRLSAALPLPEVSRPSARPSKNEPPELVDKVYANMGNRQLTLFSIGAPSGVLLPSAALKKEIIRATRELTSGGAEYELIEGSEKLRRMIAVRSTTWGGSLDAGDLITTSGGMNALFLSLMAVAKPGDTVAVESPCYPGILQMAVSLALKVLELPTHPATGLEVDALKKAIPRINICLLVPNFNTPLGSCMPDEHKKEVVALLAKNNIPLIEDDVYGDLNFGKQRPKCCKSFDEQGNVLWCSSVSKTLAPGFRVGWVAGGRYKEKIQKLKLIHSISSASVIHEAVGNFFQSGKYDAHMRRLRRTLQQNYQNYVNAIAEHFPEGTKTSRPQGGLALWVQFDKNIDTAELFESAIKQKISIAPGRMFTLQRQFTNCMRLCIALPWTENLKFKLKRLGSLAKMLQ